MSQDPATLVVVVTVLLQQHLKTLTDLVELSLNGNPVCSTLGADDASVSDHLRQLFPQLEVVNGVRCHSNHK